MSYPALAAEIEPELLRAETIVTGKEEPERTRGFKECVTQIIVKLTGDAALAQSPKIDPFLAQSSRYIASFTYEDRNKHLKINDEQGTRERPHFLRVEADLANLEADLNAAGLPIKRMPRRPTILLLEVTDARGKYLVTQTEAKGYEMREVLQSAARKRGLTFFLPANDLTLTKPDSLARAGGAKPLYVKGVMAQSDSGFWTFSAVAFGSVEDLANVKSVSTCPLVNLDGVSFDRALGQMTDRLLALMTAAPTAACLPD